MTRLKTLLTVGTLVMAIASPAVAQDPHAGHGPAVPAGADQSVSIELPEICRSDVPMAGDMAMSDHQMDRAHTDLMAGMDETNRQMMDAMMLGDIDVAFVCAMIPHHQGAINMARAELAHGDNAWAKDMAQKVIDAQEQEIADMIAWLESEGAAE